MSLLEQVIREYPMSPTGGIDFAGLFAKAEVQPTGEFNSLSGRSLRYSFTDHTLEINDAIFQLKATVYSPLNLRILSYNLYTKKPSHVSIPNQEGIDTHPDFFARKFAHIAHACLEERTGELSALYGSWSLYSRNLKEFCDIYQQSDDKVVAAQNTWTGRLAHELGFTELEPEAVRLYLPYPHGQPCVKAIFTKPESLSADLKYMFLNSKTVTHEDRVDPEFVFPEEIDNWLIY